MDPRIVAIGARAEAGTGCTEEEALFLASPHAEFETVLYWANRVRRRFHGMEVGLCAIVNARSGRCSENCRYCAQSSHYPTEAEVYPLLSAQTIIKHAEQARAMGAGCFGIVTSGATVQGKDLDAVCEAIHHITHAMQYRCSASFGRMSDGDFKKLKDAGLPVYHHNLETSRRFYPSICTTHDYEERIDTVRRAQAAGLSICCGGLMGLGEGWEDRVSLAAACRELGSQSVPLNFLHPAQGTPLEHQEPLSPRDILRTIAIFRMMLPSASLRFCGGRERNLREMQSWIFHAGANAMMIGNYLTTKGRNLQHDHQLVADAGMQWGQCHCGTACGATCAKK